MGFNPTYGNISGASDVALSNPATDHVFVYNGTIGKWVNTPISQLDAIDDLNTLVSNETTNRINADNALDARVDVLEAANTPGGGGSGGGEEARRLLAGANPLGSDEATYAGSPMPTVTFTANTSTSSISGAVRIAPKRLSSTEIDVTDDPHWYTIGCPQGKLKVSSSDMTRPDLLTNGSAQAARFSPRFRITWTGQAIEFYYRAVSTSLLYRIWIDGAPLSQTFTSQTGLTAGQRGLIKLDFGTIVTRMLEIEIFDPEFGGAFIEPTASVIRPQTQRLVLAAIGDSHTAGASGVSRHDTWLRRTANHLNVEWSNLAIGGSGFLIGGTGSSSTVFRNRITPDVVPTSPDILIIEGSWNDSASTVGDLTTEAAYVYNALKTALPNTLLIASGPWVVNHNLNATLDSFDAALRAQAQASGFHGYISFRDPEKLVSVASAWAGSTAYTVGDTVVYNGFAQKCVTAHTSTSTFDQTKWRSTAIVKGTGKVGSTTGDGNADLLVMSDGIHGTLLAHQVKARFVTSEILRIVRATASGVTWAN